MLKTKTKWYICLALILFGGLIGDTFNQVVGTVIIGLAAYQAGVFHILLKIERDENEFKELLGGKKE